MRRAVDTLMGLGVDGREIKVLMGERPHDVREEPEGAFGGELPPEHAVGEFAGPPGESDEGAGTFAGSAAAQRGGSFADADRETVTSYPAGVERQRVASHHALRKLLTDAGLDADTAERDIVELHHGRVLLLADVGDRDVASVDTALAR
ncbi:MAG TPA: hypothetical protein VE570_04435 [Thermoleophilaceae bacterium]|nr:hypothetical protein [Thermoleophilaceae bacterium]